jgi:hypothetical protein
VKTWRWRESGQLDGTQLARVVSTGADFDQRRERDELGLLFRTVALMHALYGRLAANEYSLT